MAVAFDSRSSGERRDPVSPVADPA